MKMDFYNNRTMVEVEEILKQTCTPQDSARLSKSIRAVFLGNQMKVIYNLLGDNQKSTGWVVIKTGFPSGSVSSMLMKLESIGLITSTKTTHNRKLWKRT